MVFDAMFDALDALRSGDVGCRVRHVHDLGRWVDSGGAAGAELGSSERSVEELEPTGTAP